MQHRVGSHLAAAGHPGTKLAAAVSSSGLRAADGDSQLAGIANAAFVSGFRLILLIGCLTLLAGAVFAAVLVQARAFARATAVDPGQIRP